MWCSHSCLLQCSTASKTNPNQNICFWQWDPANKDFSPPFLPHYSCAEPREVDLDGTSYQDLLMRLLLAAITATQLQNCYTTLRYHLTPFRDVCCRVPKLQLSQEAIFSGRTARKTFLFSGLSKPGKAHKDRNRQLFFLPRAGCILVLENISWRQGRAEDGTTPHFQRQRKATPRISLCEHMELELWGGHWEGVSLQQTAFLWVGEGIQHLGTWMPWHLIRSVDAIEASWAPNS